MNRILLVIILFSPFANNAQYSQSDPWEKIELPKSKDDFTSILNLWKQFNSIHTSELLELDSILFYKNDTLKFTYYITDLRFFQKNMALMDSVLKASTDSVYNDEKNSFDFFFTDIEKNKLLDSRKYLNKDGRYFKAEQFSEGNITMLTNWQFDNHGNIINETNKLTQDSSVYDMSYRKNKSVIRKRHAKVKTKTSTYEYIINYNKKGGLTKYTYRSLDHKSQERKNDLIKIKRDKNNLTRSVKAKTSNKSITFNFSYSKNHIQIIKQALQRQTIFKLVTF